MVDCGLPQWVAMVISGEGVSEYTLRYCLALLMNLSLRGAGRRACVGVGPTLLRTLGWEERMEEGEREGGREFHPSSIFYRFPNCMNLVLDRESSSRLTNVVYCCHGNHKPTPI